MSEEKKFSTHLFGGNKKFVEKENTGGASFLCF
jgi:hypothetical protein